MLQDRCADQSQNTQFNSALKQSTSIRKDLNNLSTFTPSSDPSQPTNLTPAALGSFLLDVPRPLAIGSVELVDGSWWKGFVCEAVALDGAIDITHTGGWRRHLATTVG